MRIRSICALTAGAIAATVGLAPFPGQADTPAAETIASFSGSAEAIGLRATMTVTPATLTDTPVDGGGPTAHATVDSYGSSNGYAAFPDPGQAYVTIPSTVSGVLAGGAGGLPPIESPTPPNYPFFVASDPANVPEAHAGAGFYELTASSQPRNSTSSARIGFATGMVGNAAQMTSTAAVGPTPEGTVVSEATSHLESLTIGPIAIGEIRSMARLTANGFGPPTPTTDLQINALRIGGLPAQVDSEGLDVGGPTVPLPLGDAANQVLEPTGITIELVAPQRSEDSILAPAIQITMPYQAPESAGVGGYTGSLRIIVGSARASLIAGTHPAPTSAAEPTPVAAEAGTNPAPALEAVPNDPQSLAGAGAVTERPAPLPPSPVAFSVPPPEPAPSLLPAPPEQQRTGLMLPATSQQRAVLSTLNTRGGYLMVVLVGAALALVVPLRRSLGVTS